jgi:hypothetical protein
LSESGFEAQKKKMVLDHGSNVTGAVLLKEVVLIKESVR